jgi:hypothetical protein
MIKFKYIIIIEKYVYIYIYIIHYHYSKILINIYDNLYFFNIITLISNLS